ncbi:MAG: hypothetical protein Q4C47_09075 [Planctomycetia bacterium]|nr:hypothetical protein [Planctomycetia bacterium]
MRQITRRKLVLGTVPAIVAGMTLRRVGSVSGSAADPVDSPVETTVPVPELPDVLRREFFISYWWGPNPTDASFRQIAEGGFTVAQAGGGRRTLDLAQKYGLKVVMEDPRLLAKEPDDPGFHENLDAVVADFADHPALWGYHLIDEPGTSAFPKLAAINQYLLHKDPEHVPYMNLFPTYAAPHQLGTASQQMGAESYGEYVRRFVDEVKPVFLSYDHYSMFRDGTRREDFYENFEIIRRESLRAGIPFNFILLSCPHFNYRNPDEAELWWQVNSALVYGAHGVQYFTYLTPPEDDPGFEGWHDAITTYEGEPLRKYGEIRGINADVRSRAEELLNLRSLGVYHTDPLPAGTSPLSAQPESQRIIAKVRGEAELVIGVFRDVRTDTLRLMIVNRSETRPCEAGIALTEGYRFERPIAGQTKATWSDDTGREMTVTLGAGDAVTLSVER